VWSRGQAPTPHITSITTHSATALREFLDGERLWSRGAYHAAGDAYLRSAHADTAFWFAAYRYQLARTWIADPVEDTSVIRRLSRHRNDLPERERALGAVGDAAPSQSERIRRLQALVARYPDYAPGWQTLADILSHDAGRSGHGPREAIDPWRQVARLAPNDVAASLHLVHACVASGDQACAREAMERADALMRASWRATATGARPAELLVGVDQQRQLSMITLALEPMTVAKLDSLIKAGTRDSTLPVLVREVAVGMAPALVSQPDFFRNLDRTTRAVVAALPRGGLPPAYAAELMAVRAARGAWAALDSAADLHLPEGGSPFLPLHSELVRARVLAELQGALPPLKSSVDWAVPRAEDAKLSPGARTEARWLVAVNALVRGDSALFRAQLAAIPRDTVAAARIAARSLRALALGLGGKRGAAAESLLALEREHGENPPKVWGAFAADRLLGAQWLEESKRYAQADSLLEFTRGFVIGTPLSAAWPVFAAAQLERSRIAEGMGNRDEAVRYATIFVRAYDLAPEAHRAQIDEAKQRIARLGGTLDAPTAPRAP